MNNQLHYQRSTDSIPHNIFLVVEDEGNRERLHIVQLDPERGEMTSVGEIPHMYCPSVVSFADTIFCLGDLDCSGLIHQFDFVTRTARTPTRLLESVRFTASAASSHEFIVSGGQNKSEEVVATCSVYAPARNRWTSLRQLRQARHSHRMCWLPDGRVFVIGGFGVRVLSSVEMLERACVPALREEASAEWRNVASMKMGRRSFGCCIVEGRIMVAGGRTNWNPSSVELFEPPTTTNTGQWTSLTNLASHVYSYFLVPSTAGLVLIDREGGMHLGRRKAQVQFPSFFHPRTRNRFGFVYRNGGGMTLGRRKVQVAPSEWDLWTWETRPALTSFRWCRGLLSLPSIASSQR